MMNLKNFQTHLDGRGVFIATLSVPDRPVNVLDDSVLQDLNAIVEFVQHDSHKPDGQRTVRMLLFRSGKPAGFLAGADIHRLQSIQNRTECEWILEQGQTLFNKLESLSIPTVALIHGACVGGGLEFVMSCKYRLAVDNASTKLGLPEVKLGLIPAWGGTQRLPRLVGISTALPMLLEGKLLSAQAAYEAKLVHRLISPDQLETELDGFVARRLGGVPVARTPRSLTKWLLDSNPFGRSMVMRMARREIEKPSRNYPALARILDAAEIGLRSKTLSSAGLAAERAAFCDLILGDVAPHLIGLFLRQEEARKTSTWTDNTEQIPVRKIAVIGAGTMGAGIAQLAAARGYSVLLQDLKEEFVNRGMGTIRSLFTKAVEKGAMERNDAEQSIAQIQSRVDWGPSDDIDLMIEAIVERLDTKEFLFKKADDQLPLHAVLASNTSALPINEMAQATHRPEKVGGLHFFNPVHKMPLVEVVRAPMTSDETIATLVGVAKRLGKTPVVVNQSPGFLVNRILFPYLDEAARLVLEGESVENIDRAARRFGMPMGPLELLDVVGLDVALDVSSTLAVLATESSPSPELFARLVDLGHKGQKSGRGFYEWDHSRRLRVAPQPDGLLPVPKVELDDWTIEGETFSPIQQRLILTMVNEAQKCLVEKVVPEAWMVDLGMVLGTGFAPFRGGPMACLEKWGRKHVVARLNLLRERCGARFTSAPKLDQLDRDVSHQVPTEYHPRAFL